MAEFCQCADCALFVPDCIGFGQGIGRCQAFEDYKALNPSPVALDKTFRMLGNKVFWGGNDGNNNRFCEKFVRKE